MATISSNYNTLTRSRAIARDPALFPDPEAFNPVRWVDPSYPTYKEPLTEYPTIINSTQFGYGRRLCQGQGVADEDMLIGIGSIAWLFNIKRNGHDALGSSTSPSVVADPEKVEVNSLGMNEKASVSSEELNAGLNTQGPTMEDIILSKYSYPGSFPATAEDEEPAVKPKSPEKTSVIDPTLDFTTLLIAKPLPFKFDLSPRDAERASKVRAMYDEGVDNGDYKPSREFWGENQGVGRPLGWGVV